MPEDEINKKLKLIDESINKRMREQMVHTDKNNKLLYMILIELQKLNKKTEECFKNQTEILKEVRKINEKFDEELEEGE